MKKLKCIWLCLLLSSVDASFAQSENRGKVISLLLAEARFRVHQAPQILLAKEAKDIPELSVLAQVDALPKYSLPKGNIVCRLEEYVQLHTPLKFNIGVGGQ